MELMIWKIQVEIDKLIISLEILKIFLKYDGDRTREGGIYSEKTYKNGHLGLCQT